jgi:N-acetyl-beta-hexosaminidase
MKSGLLLCLALLQLVTGNVHVPAKSYACQENGMCALNKPGVDGVAQGTCLLTCGKGNLWPYPRGPVQLGKSVSYFKLSTASFRFRRENQMKETKSFQSVAERFQSNFIEELDKLNSGKKIKVNNEKHTDHKIVHINTHVRNQNIVRPSPSNDDSYSLKIGLGADGNIEVSISAETIFGSRNALETVSQLIAWDELVGSLVIASDVNIVDSAAFPYRGVMIDVSRHFISVNKLKESIRAMGYNKMNVLHLHLSDTASFPATIPSEPRLTSYGAYDDDSIYSVDGMKDLVDFAAGYGVMILPEIDAPAHVSAGWQWGEEAGLGPLVVCNDPYGHQGRAWTGLSLEPPDGQLNIANENIYPILDNIYHDIITQIPSPYFHIGGDEVIVGSDSAWASCYNSSTRGKPIVDYLASIGASRQDASSFYTLWENFTVKETQLVQQQYATQGIPLQKLHIWAGGGDDDSGVVYNLMTQPNLQEFLPPSLFTVQVWDESKGSIVPTLIEQGYDVVLSNTDYVYLDCGVSGWSEAGQYWCQPYHEWFHIYEYMADVTKEWQLTSEQRKKIVGSETLIWTEETDDTTVSQKLWPRSAALAEALWSDPTEGWFAANARMQQWRNKLVARGVMAEALQPLWCQQRAGDVCTTNSGKPQ